MHANALALRFRRLQMPTGLLILLLQRTPMLRVAIECESLIAESAPAILRSAFAVLAMGAYHSLAGATVFNVAATPVAAVPTSGAANATFAVTEASGTAVSIGISVSGAPGNPRSWSVSGTLPAGLTLTGATGTYVNVTAPYKMTIAGTPTAAGSFPVTVTAWDGLNGSGGNNAKIKVNFTITGGVTNTAPTITTQPSSQTVTAGASVSFTVAASGTPAPTFQWQKGGANVAGATSATYTIASVVVGDAGSYAAVATNSVGSATSSAATLTVNPAATAPVITTQPANLTVTAGTAASFTVAASGTPAPTIQWQKGGANIAGATSVTYTIASAGAVDAGSYTAVATNSAGSATSSAATLTVNPAPAAPAITTQPTNLTVAPGNPAAFTVAASGNPAPTYQWQKGGANLAGATNSTYSIASVTAGDAGNYTAVATNSLGQATSATATLTVSSVVTAPAITTQPASLTLTAGTSASFTVAASGSPTPSYQWQKGGVNIAGATGATFTIASVAAGDAGSYAAVATNSGGSATSSAATLTVNAALTAPAITTQPVSLTVTIGNPASFTVAASGNPAPTLQWQKGGVDLAGATSATFTIASVVAGDAGNYTAMATNSVGNATSTIAALTVTAAASAPVITSQPASQTVAAGTPVAFTVAASGSPAPTYQWFLGGIAINGATGATLSLANVQAADTGDYSVTVSNSAGSTTSTTVKLTVQAPQLAVSSLNQIVTAGHAAALAVIGASGPLQWQVSTDGGLTWANLADNATYSGVNSSVLEILGVTSSMNGNRYRCVPSNGGASYASAAMMLTVAPAYFPFPTSVGADPSGNLFVGDASAQTIQRISAGGQFFLLAGLAGQSGSADGAGSSARFNQPGGIAVAVDGSVSVADTANNSIRAVTASGSVTSLAGLSGSQGSVDGTGATARFWTPIGIARDSNGTLLVADSRNHTIRKVTSGGAVTTFAGSAGAAGSADGNGSNARFNNPAGLAVDVSGNLYVADAANNTIRKITPAGDVTTLAGLAGVSGSQDGAGGNARFNNPGGLAVGSSGDLYLADTGNSTIRAISPSGVVTTIAGLPGVPGLMDGTGGNAWFDQPEGVALGMDGNLYVADTGNAVIRKVTLAGEVTTLALSAGTSTGSTGSTSGTGSGSSGGTSGTGNTTGNSGGSGSAAGAPMSAGAGAGGLDGWLASILGLAWLLRWLLKKS